MKGIHIKSNTVLISAIGDFNSFEVLLFIANIVFFHYICKSVFSGYSRIIADANLIWIRNRKYALKTLLKGVQLVHIIVEEK